MVGVVVNGERLNRTQEELASILTGLSDLSTGSLKELKGKNLLRGGGPWRAVDGEQRRATVTGLCEWLVVRKHTLALAAIDHEAFETAPQPGTELRTIWRAGAFHIALQLQRAHRTSGNKGKTVLVFDDNKQEMDNLVDLIASPPPWSEDYYDRPQKKPPLDQLIDTPFAVSPTMSAWFRLRMSLRTCFGATRSCSHTLPSRPTQANGITTRAGCKS